MSVILVAAVSVLSVSHSWLKVFVEGVEDLFDCTMVTFTHAAMHLDSITHFIPYQHIYRYVKEMQTSIPMAPPLGGLNSKSFHNSKEFGKCKCEK